MPPEIARLADTFRHHPERIEVSAPATAATTIVQRLKKTSDEPAAKRQALRELMKEVDVKNAIIFCNRKKDVGVVFRSLQRHGFNVGALHGDMDQRQRTATLDAFRNGTIAFLAASDVAARGLDIPAVSHIFNYDVPVHPEDYIHRIGRTGRAGREGFAAMLVTPKDRKALKAIEAMLRQEIPWLDGAATSSAPEEVAETETSERGNGRGRRRGGRSRRGGQKSASPSSEAKPAQRSEAPTPAPTPPKAAESNSRPPKAAEGNGRPQKAAEGNGRSQKPREAQGRDGRREKQESKDDSRRSDQPQAKARGMGDHVPAFMMRSVRVP